jgi:hypothetical protein
MNNEQAVTPDKPEYQEMRAYMKTLRVLCGNDKNDCCKMFMEEYKVTECRAQGYFAITSYK